MEARIEIVIDASPRTVKRAKLAAEREVRRIMRQSGGHFYLAQAIDTDDNSEVSE